MKILQRNLNTSTFVVWEMWRHHNMCWKWPPFASRQDWIRRAIFLKVLASTSANNKHSLLHSIPIQFSNYPVWTHTLHWHSPYCVGTLSQMTERSAERHVRQETGWIVGGPLLHVPTIRSITDTHYRHIPLHFSHNESIAVQISLQYPYWC